MRAVNGSAIAWWYLSCGARNAHCFIAVFVHNHRDELMVEIAEGKSNMIGFPKDDHIVKPGWSYSDKTRRRVLSQVLKYAYAIVESRVERGFKLEFHSFSPHTGVSDTAMMAWEARHNYETGVTQKETPRPSWWPTERALWALNEDGDYGLVERREALASEGLDLVQLVNSVANEKRRRKMKRHGRTYRRVGRFLVCAKD